MATVAIKNIPIRFKGFFMEKTLGNVIRGNFSTINFAKQPGGKAGTKTPQYKILYIKLAANLDPQHVIEAINSQTSFVAFIPKVPPTGKKAMNTHVSTIPLEARVLLTTHEEIMTEMQCKFTGLYNLAKKTNFKLLDEIAWVVFERLKTIADRSSDPAPSGFKLSSAYRKAHPHFGDFQLILSTLHKLQDLAGAPRAHIVESELCKVSDQPYTYVIDNVPMDKVQGVCNKYSDRITKKLTDHIAALDTEIQSGNEEEDGARKKVREQLKKLSPFMDKIVREVISNHFIPQKSPYHKVRIYGEPFLPRRDTMDSVINKCGAAAVMRSDRMYNLLKCSVPVYKYRQLFAQDGTSIGGAKLNIRSSFVPLYFTSRVIKNEMRHTLGVFDADDDDVGSEGDRNDLQGDGDILDESGDVEMAMEA